MLPLVSTRRLIVDRPRAVELARQQLATDGVAHVVGEQREPFDPELGDERHDDVRLLGERVRLVGLRREPVAEEVEQEHAAGAAQIVEHRGEVVRRAREPVEHEQRFVPLRLERGRDQREDRVPGELRGARALDSQAPTFSVRSRHAGPA